MKARSLPWSPGSMVATIVGLFFAVSFAQAQPTYKLDVKDHLKPLATLKLEGARLSRSAVQDDPGFRLQYHFKKDGKSLAVVEGRSNPALEIPQKEPGTYTVVLELFYPAYKGGVEQKGAFRAVSNVLTFMVYKDGQGQARYFDIGTVETGLLYGLSRARLVPVPEGALAARTSLPAK